MNTKSYCRQLKNISIAAALCCFFWLYWTFGRMYAVLTNPPSVSEGYETVPFVIAIGYAVSSLALVCVLGYFLYHQNKSLRDGTIFTKRCQHSLFIWSVLWPIYDICAANMGNIQNNSLHVISVEGSAIGITFLVFTFALLYKIARQVAEDNQLTI